MVLKHFQEYLAIFKFSRKKVQGASIGPKGGPLEKTFLETCFYKLKLIVLMKDNVFDAFKAFSSKIRIFQIWPKKSSRAEHRIKGGTIKKKCFGNMFL